MNQMEKLYQLGALSAGQLIRVKRRTRVWEGRAPMGRAVAIKELRCDRDGPYLIVIGDFGHEWCVSPQNCELAE